MEIQKRTKTGRRTFHVCIDQPQAEGAVVVVKEISTTAMEPSVFCCDSREMFPWGQHTEADTALVLGDQATFQASSTI